MNGYKLWNKIPNTICEGARMYTKTFHFETKNPSKERLVRVYIPSTYDFDNPNKRFKVLYMLDGKNLFDDYTSFVGEWGIDETIEEMIRKGESEGYIVVGVDAPFDGDDRMLEMIPEELVPRKVTRLPNAGYASLLGKFIFETVKPDIDRTFYTLSDKEHTGIGGSSAGGLMAFHLGLLYSDKIKYCLNFSPAFFLFRIDSYKKYLDRHFNSNLPRQYFYVGGVGFESWFIKRTKETYEYFLKNGYTNDQVKYLCDMSQEHNEKAWRIYFPLALKEMDR